MLPLADTITADMGFLPGMELIGPAFGWPFYFAAGVREKTIWYSLQANCVSLFLGYVCAVPAIGILDAIFRDAGVFLLWPVCAVVLHGTR